MTEKKPDTVEILATWPEKELRDDAVLTIRVSRKLHHVLSAESEQTGRSINSLVTICIETVLHAQGKWPPKGDEPAKAKPRRPPWMRRKESPK
jgi:hypothetical protein